MGHLLNWMGWGGRENANERLQMRVTYTVKERLIALKVNTGAKSISELAQWGFTLVEWAWNITRDDGRVIVEKSDGTQTDIVFPWQEEHSGK